MLEGLEEDVSISFSEKPEEIEVGAEPACLTWVEFNLESSREVCYGTIPKERVVISKPKDARMTKNRLDDIAENIKERYLKYGKLDSTQRIAKKSGALKRDDVCDKDINYYDQDDPFIDDSDCLGNNMVIPEVTLGDFVCVQGDIKVLKNSKAFKERQELVKSINQPAPHEMPKPNKHKNSDKKQQKPNKNVQTTSQKAANSLTSKDATNLASILSGLVEPSIPKEDKKDIIKPPKKRKPKNKSVEGAATDPIRKGSEGSNKKVKVNSNPVESLQSFAQFLPTQVSSFLQQAQLPPQISPLISSLLPNFSLVDKLNVQSDYEQLMKAALHNMLLHQPKIDESLKKCDETNEQLPRQGNQQTEPIQIDE